MDITKSPDDIKDAKEFWAKLSSISSGAAAADSSRPP